MGLPKVLPPLPYCHLFIPTDMVVYAQPYLSHGTCDAYRRVVHKTFTGVIVKAITHSFMGFDE